MFLGSPISSCPSRELICRGFLDLFLLCSILKFWHQIAFGSFWWELKLVMEIIIHRDDISNIRLSSYGSCILKAVICMFKWSIELFPFDGIYSFMMLSYHEFLLCKSKKNDDFINKCLVSNPDLYSL